MEFEPGKLYHVFNQGNNQQPIFFGRDNYIFFLNKMRLHLNNHCEIIAWCLMPNHFHWLIKVSDDYPVANANEIQTDNMVTPVVYPLNRGISTLLSSYTKAVNKSNNMSGALFRSRTKALLLNDEEQESDNYPLICFLYIHQNPFRAGLVNRLDSWKFSSYKDYAGIRKGSLCNIKLGKNLFELPASNEEFIKFSKQTIPDKYLDRFL